MDLKIKNGLLFGLFSLCIGAIAGGIIWIFFKIMNLSISFLWEFIPSHFSIPFYTILICVVGGLLIGLWQKKFGDYPEELPEVMKKVKEKGRYEYKNIFPMCISALLPLTFGGSVGPEAGLTGVIAGLCTWVGDKFKHAFKEIHELAQIGISATLGAIFHAPMFGFVEPLESEEDTTTLPKTSKIVVYFLAILGALAIFKILGNWFGAGAGLPSFSHITIDTKEWLYLLPLAIIGSLAGILNHAFGKASQLLSSPLSKHPIIRCTLAGLLLGIVGTFFPLVMFSGEHQMTALIQDWSTYTVLVLLSTAILKLFITNTCIHLGFKGGSFFPSIFAGVSLGYAFAMLTGIDSTFCVVVIATALMASTMRKPIAAVLLMMLCFPIEALFPMIITAIIANLIPLPKLLRETIAMDTTEKETQNE